MTVSGLCNLLKTFTNYSILNYNGKFIESSKSLKRALLISNFSTNKIFLFNEEEKPKNYKVFVKKGGVEVKKKVPTSLKVSVININGTKDTMYLEQAEKIARHNNYRLVKVPDNSNKIVYQFLKGHSFGLDNENKQKENRIKAKKIVFGSEILQNDLQYKVNQINKLLKKGKVVSVVLEKKQNNENKVVSFSGCLLHDKYLKENTYNFIIKEVGPDCKIINKSKKGFAISFTILPPGNKEESEGGISNADKGESNIQNNLT